MPKLGTHKDIIKRLEEFLDQVKNESSLVLIDFSISRENLSGFNYFGFGTLKVEFTWEHLLERKVEKEKTAPEQIMVCNFCFYQVKFLQPTVLLGHETCGLRQSADFLYYFNRYNGKN